MGIAGLDSYTRENVPNGYLQIDMEVEIRKHLEAVAETSPSPTPIIVIDLISLYTPLSKYNEMGLPFGGRFNLADSVVEEFIEKLKLLGVDLVFFCKSPMQQEKSTDWCKVQDNWYSLNLIMFDVVDRGIELDDFLRLHSNMLNFRYPLTNVARRHGLLKIATTRDCNKELATYASESGALAIISNDSDFLVFEGPWRYWSSQVLELSTLKTMEYNRPALLRHLKLTSEQMPLFATLCGNKIMPAQIGWKLQKELGCCRISVSNIAKFVHEFNGPLKNIDIIILQKILNATKLDEGFLKLFQRSLIFYNLAINPIIVKPMGDPVLEILSKKDSPFYYHIWQGIPLDVAIGIVDLRNPGFNYKQLLTTLILRMAGVILFHKKPQRPTKCPIIIKFNHASRHQEYMLPIQYPSDVKPPTFIKLLSEKPSVSKRIQNEKFQLLAWIASDNLQPDDLLRVPELLRLTVYTLYYLVEQTVLELFEADLLLQVAYDVIFKTYDLHSVEYPTTIKGRPYRVVFLFQKVYAFTSKAFRLLGGHGDDYLLNNLPFDGVLFHSRYDEWSRGQYNMDKIRNFRIYEELNASAPSEEPGWHTVKTRKRRNL
ncbi:constitutive coactivator of PPAR-gamma-like protein 1 homolog [Armigeres subalbatus]|uniref:constitutive coactivator of PPAR-gamma-like protein 1 homolog n=1 Tax=Armigeres subalbatus TaxID=124917 RepID=UPI002ED3EC60